MQSITNKELIAQSKVQRILVELFEGMETVKSSGSQGQFYTKWLTEFKQQIILRAEKIDFLPGCEPSRLQFNLYYRLF